MERISTSSVRGQRFIYSYNRATARRLRDVYGRYSCAKACAENDCIRWCEAENGHGFKIISANSCFFTAAWLTSDGLRVETARGSYLVA